MKIKVKYTPTRKFMVTLDNPTLATLKQEIREFVEKTYRESVREPFSVSLNGSDPLAGPEDATLQSLGVVGGDLLSIICAPCEGQEQQPPLAAPPVAAPPPPVVPPAPDTASVRKENEGGDRGVKEREGVGGGSGSPRRCVSGAEDQPQYLMEARDGHPPASLSQLMSECQPESGSQVVNLLVHLNMLECNFQLVQETGFPPGWQGTVATFQYKSTIFLDFQCTLVLVTMGAVKQVLASFPQQETEITVRLTVSDYVREGATTPLKPQDLVRVAQLARTLRDHLLYPLQVAAHQVLGVPAPWHLAGLPHELLLQVATMLDYKSVVALGGTCRRLKTTTSDNKLWWILYKRDFNKQCQWSEGQGVTDWKARYKDQVMMRRRSNILDDIEYDIHPHYPLVPPHYPHAPPYYPHNPAFPGMPDPIGPNPYPPQPHPVPNPFVDPDSPFFGGEIPPMPGAFPGIPNPLPPRRRGPTPGNPFMPSFIHPNPRKWM